jgi:type I restriction enzyme S subunit
LVGPSDVVYSKIRPELRKATFPRITALCSADAYPLTPKHGIDPDFLVEVLLTEQFSASAIARSGRTKMPKVNRRELMTIEVPHVGPDDQHQIGLSLKAVRGLLEAAIGTLRAANQARRAMVTALVSGDRRIPVSYDRLLDASV